VREREKEEGRREEEPSEESGLFSFFLLFPHMHFF
jgi:hypothetical protein